MAPRPHRSIPPILACVLLAAGVAFAAPQPRAATADPLAPELRQSLAAAAADDWLAVGVTLRRDDLPAPGPPRQAAIAARQQRVLDALPAGSFHLRRRYQLLAGLAGVAHPSAIEALARHPEVRTVYPDGRVRPSLVQGVALIGADEAHAAELTGDGVTVAILDTGIDTNHPDLQDDLVGEQCYCSDPHPSPVIGSPCCPNGQATQSGPGAAEDDEGHGTSVSGIVSSDGVVAPPGVAPDADLVAIRVLGPQGGAFSDIAAGLDWVLLHRDDFTHPIRVVNLSLGDGNEHANPNGSPCSGSNTADAIAELAGAGVTVFAASGNEGFDDGISFPACVAEAVSVGGVYDASFQLIQWCGNANCTTVLCSDASVTPDDFVCHSNSDEILDVLAPDFQTRTSAVGGGVETSFGGTSAASPYAAGQAALLIQMDPSLTPAQVLGLMAASGPMVTNPDNGLAFPRPDVGAIIDLLSDCGNGVLEPGEGCDDGNTAGGDCCAADCSPELEGSPCDDADACTSLDICTASGCLGVLPLACDDGNLCTDDGCDPATGCTASPNTSPCDDGDACTAGDVCGGGFCLPGSPAVCDDGNLCTDDGCDPATGCTADPNTDPCDDGDACTAGDACDAGACQGGAPPDCDDGNPCTAESCDAIEGCVSTPVVGCAPAVPAASGSARAMLAVLLVLTGASLAARRAAKRPA